MTPGHQAYKVFIDDVNSTYQRIQTRAAEIAAERAANPSAHEGAVEQIQLQAVEPGAEIHINVPQPGSSETVEQQARAIFDTFPPGLQRALESGSLDRVNEVLGKMSVEEAEEVVGQMGEHGMLDMRQGVMDDTTEEGREQIRRMKEGIAAADERIHVPPQKSEDAGEQEARTAFEELPLDLQQALDSGKMEQVGDVLKKLSETDAEKLLRKMGDNGILDLHQVIDDATLETGEAPADVEGLERQSRGLAVEDVD